MNEMFKNSSGHTLKFNTSLNSKIVKNGCVLAAYIAPNASKIKSSTPEMRSKV